MPSLTPRKVAGLGWKPDLPDARDLTFAPPEIGTLPDHVDLRDSGSMPEPYDQGQLGSCTGNALAGAVEFDQAKQGLAPFTPSRLFIYYHERVLEGTVDQDAGAMLRDGAKVLHNLGAPPETDWPYDIRKFAQEPPAKATTDALSDRAIEYRRVYRNHMLACLAAGFPFAFGFSVYESFESAAASRTGDITMPSGFEQLLGGHAVLAVGYDMPSYRFIFRNSWGTGWGDGGYGTMPFDYLNRRDLSSDFWVIRSVGA